MASSNGGDNSSASHVRFEPSIRCISAPKKHVLRPEQVLMKRLALAQQSPEDKQPMYQRRQPRYFQPHYRPLPTNHPAFGIQEAFVPRKPKKPPLSTVHPAFGDPPPKPKTKPAEVSSPAAAANDPEGPVDGPVTMGGFFLAIDPQFCFPFKRNDSMNPNAQITIRDPRGYLSRIRYRCLLEAGTGLKLEAIVRFQVGWISPAVRFAELPHVIHLGSGFDVSIPFVMHFTMVSILDENGCKTGSNLYFSGTPFLGLSAGFSKIKKGRLVLNLEKEVDLVKDNSDFVGPKGHKVHKRQIGFVALKAFSWLACMVFCVPYFDLWTKTKNLAHQYVPDKYVPIVLWLIPQPTNPDDCACAVKRKE